MRSIVISVVLLAACVVQNPFDDDQPAQITLRIDLEPPVGLAEDLNPTILRILVCDNIQLSAEVHIACSLENKDYNVATTSPAPFDTVTVSDVPPAKNQVIIAQGQNDAQLVTYQGFVTFPVIEPGGKYNAGINLRQVLFPALPPPEPPTITTPSATPFTATAGTTFVFEGTREAGTVLRVKSPSLSGMPTPLYLNSDTGIYQEETSGAVTTWTLVVFVPHNPVGTIEENIGAFTFSAARIGEDRFSDEVTFVMWACTAGEPC